VQIGFPEERRVKVIQDVTTRWWSTYQMCERLIRLRPCVGIMTQQNERDANLAPQQWDVVVEVAKLLEPLMQVQQLHEGDYYCTVSFIPFLIDKIRRGLQNLIGTEEDQSIIGLAERMLETFNEHWGTGYPGTVFHDHQRIGRRPLDSHSQSCKPPP
jgi:hypothetical protein